MSKVMHDKDDWISYWIYEQDFGKEWDENTACEEDGTPIVCTTPRQLYDFLLRNAGESHEGGWSDQDYDRVAAAYIKEAKHEE